MSARPNRTILASALPARLAELIGVPVVDLTVHASDPSGADFVITAGQTFVVDFNLSTSAAPVAAAARKVRAAAERVGEGSIPLVAVPFMGDAGRQACAEVGVGWMDLSGNAHIEAPGLRILIEGRPNRFRTVGRPENLFAPKSSRIARQFLLDPERPLTQRELAHATGLDEGFVSRLVARLLTDQYVARDERGALRPTNPNLLLDAWRDAYRFDGHSIRRGHVVSRSGDALLRFTADTLRELGVDYAATGLAGAWVLSPFAGFRLATVFVRSDPSTQVLQRLGFREEDRGANLWLVVPNDEGVFLGARTSDGIRCAHPAQVYVDLKGQPERAPEAAQHLRSEFLTWSAHG